MGRKAVKEEKSDGIEIISIGKLYSGSWDKKYWSSSRGKDRYPYPVGYRSLRTQNGVTYTMEIFEGLKGPAFTISSTDGKSCSGDTPDIAWESFQKKSFSKLWHGKRSSSKIDGVEFFGFKNTFVQRLLRELVANVGGTAEEGLSPSSFPSGISETVNHLQCKPSNPNSNLLSDMAMPQVKGKRTKIAKAVNSKGLSGTNFKHHQQEKHTNDLCSSNYKQSHQCGRDPPTSGATNEASDINGGPAVIRLEKSAVIIEDEKCPTIAERGMQMDSVDIVDDLRVVDSLLHEERNLSSSANHSGFNIGNLLLNQEPVKGFNSIIPEKRGGATNLQHVLSIVHDADMCIPDSLDPAEVNDLQVPGVENDSIIKDAVKDDILVTESCPEDGIFSSENCTSSEKCHIDSIGQEIANSMMSVLLPQAVPLLKTFTRKKKKTGKPSNLQTNKLQDEDSMPKISVDGATTVCGLAEHSDTRKVCTISGGQDSAGKSDYVAPDSFDNDDPQSVFPNSDAAKADTGTAGVKFVTAANIGPAPMKEITSNSKRARFECQSLDKVPPAHASIMHGTYKSETIMDKKISDISMPEKSEARFAKLRKNTDICGRDTSCSKSEIPSTSGCRSLPDYNETKDDSRENTRQNMEYYRKSLGHLELFAHYIHPKPISMVHLIVKEKEVFVCVTCGYLEHNESTLFLYKASMNREKTSCPTLIGHAPIAFRIPKSNLGKDSAPYRSSLQLTPDAQYLVLLNSIITPYCREGKLHCSCPVCTSDFSEKNAVKILRLNKGYASLVTRLQTSQGVCCLLVCGSTVLAGEEGGKLKLWVMNSRWSQQKEDCHLPTFDSMFPSIVELKTIPNSDSLVVGHNGLGEFGLWDIKRRNLISKFSSPGMLISGLIPVSAFRWQRNGECKMKALVDGIMDATKTSFLKRFEHHMFSSEGKDATVWLLISTPSDPDSYQSSETEAKLSECWRLALLVNNTVIAGSDLDQGSCCRAASVTPMGHGIIGRPDGQVYMWELSTGLKLRNILSFKGSGTVPCITTDTSNFGALAVTSDGELLVYLPS
ncbi:DNA binding [Striga hermonthica]|uniref:DNA binding n=1 Tax=Striga hermonthica TaxID=68872 RepID=A0A9N7NE57_STRHE|nr:DNA binding [Striga hermonthica]